MKHFDLKGILVVVTVWWVISWPSFAQGQEVMFLMDISHSMQDTDNIRAVPESIREMVLSLDDEDKAGIIAFDETPWEVMPLTTVRSITLPNLFDHPYDGYTDTGLALNKALYMLEGAKAGRIVIVTDGEIMLPSPKGTREAKQQFAAGMEEAARRNIPVYILSLNNDSLDDEHRLHNSYARVIATNPPDLWLAARQLLREQLGVRGLELGGASFPAEGGGLKTLTATFPTEGVRNAKFLITASQAGRAAFPGNEMESASRTQEFRLNAPNKGDLVLDIDYPPGTQVLVDAFLELDGKLTGYLEKSWRDNTATLSVIPTTDKGEPLLDNDSFIGKSLHLTVNEEVKTAEIKPGGVISLELPDTTSDDVTVQDVRFAELGVKFLGLNFFRAEENFSKWWPWLFALVGIALCAFLYLRNRQLSAETVAQSYPQSAAPLLSLIGNNKGAYLGKLVFRITKAPDNSDPHPQEYNLFRRSQGEDITLAEILQGCGIEEKFPGAESIIFSPLPGGLVVLNRSDCTITHRHDILLKGAAADLAFGDNLHISFSDEVSEMMLTYQSLKPEETKT